jgi:hypothetical protein
MAKPAQIKTRATAASVEEFIGRLADEQKRKDSFVLVTMMEEATGDKPKMWGPAIIGFGDTRYKSAATGREVDWFKIGFSPRKANLALYGMNIKRQAALLKKLGKHKTGVGCLYINKLDEVDIKVLEQIINAAANAKS